MSNNLTVGIDIGGTAVKAGIVDKAGVLQLRIRESSKLDDYNTFLLQLKSLINNLQSQLSDRITRVGLGVAGLMDKDRLTILTAPNCGVLNNRPLPSDLSKLTGLPVEMDNDANVVAIGEGLYGAAKGSKHYIVITLGTGIGGAVVSGGRLIRGVDGGGGELGHIPIARHGLKCGCGAKGCLEAYIGQQAILNWISRNLKKYQGLDIKQIIGFAKDNDKDAQDVFKYVGETLAIGLAGLVNTYNPEIIVIGGGISAAGDFIITPLKR
ncbi:ROK family protein, partial [bacterium]|nr:ROK family protein [bacterium]